MWWILGRKAVAKGTTQIRFDSVAIDTFRNFKFTTLFNYLWMWFVILLSVALLAADCYTGVNLLVFDKWASSVEPAIPYRISRWLYAACILASLVILFLNWVIAIRTYRTRVVSLTYIDPISRNLYSVRNYSYFCLFNNISSDGMLDWCVYYVFFEVSGMVSLLLCDGPRQVINALSVIAALRHRSNNIIIAIKMIANKDNTVEAAVLSFMTLSVLIWLLFFFKLVFAIIISIPVCYTLKKRGEGGFHTYYVKIVNEKVESLVTGDFGAHRSGSERTLAIPDKFYGFSQSTVSNPSLSVPLTRKASDDGYRHNHAPLDPGYSTYGFGVGPPSYASRKGSLPSVLGSTMSKGPTVPAVTRKPPPLYGAGSHDRLVNSTETFYRNPDPSAVKEEEETLGSPPVELFSVLGRAPLRQPPIPLQSLQRQPTTLSSESLVSVPSQLSGIFGSQDFTGPTRSNTDRTIQDDRFNDTAALSNERDDPFGDQPLEHSSFFEPFRLGEAPRPEVRNLVVGGYSYPKELPEPLTTTWTSPEPLESTQRFFANLIRSEIPGDASHSGYPEDPGYDTSPRHDEDPGSRGPRFVRDSEAFAYNGTIEAYQTHNESRRASQDYNPFR